MKLISFVLFILLFSLSPMPSQAMVASPTPPIADGINKKKVGKKKRTASVRPTHTPLNPSIEIALYEDRTQLIVNIYFSNNLFASNMQQLEKDVVTLETDPVITASFKSSKDYLFAKELISQFETSAAFFMVIRPNKTRSAGSTIALNKSNWADEDIRAVQEMIVKKFEPVQVGIYMNSRAPKKLEIPSLAILKQ